MTDAGVTTDLVPTNAELSLPSTLAEAEVYLRKHLSPEVVAGLQEIRAKSDAQSLFEKRRDNHERERHYAILRLLTEAALGVLSFDEPSVVPQQHLRVQWRQLAPAFERGKLVAIAERLPAWRGHLVVQEIRKRGYDYVPAEALNLPKQQDAVRWPEARLRAQALGMPLQGLPSDRRAWQRAKQRHRETAKRMKSLHQSVAHARRIDRRKQAQRLARESEPEITEAYSLFRRLYQIMDELQAKFPDPASRDEFFYALHGVEDGFSVLLKVWDLQDWQKELVAE